MEPIRAEDELMDVMRRVLALGEKLKEELEPMGYLVASNEYGIFITPNKPLFNGGDK